MSRKKTPCVPPPAPVPPKPLPEFVQGALWALKQLDDVLWERRQGFYLLEQTLRTAPGDKQHLLQDVIEPLTGGVNENVLATVRSRLDSRITAECMRRMDERDAEVKP